MSATTDFSITDQDRQSGYDQYRVLSMAAIVCMVLGVLSLPALANLPSFTVFSLVGAIYGVMTVRRLSRDRHVVTGRGLALAGTLCCVFTLVGGLTISAYVYATEVPDGYERIGFYQLQPDPKHPELPVPPTALALDGKKIFIKGYIYPSDKGSSIKQFVLIPDLGTCCFGGQPALTDMIEVTLQDPLRTDYSLRCQRLGGVLRVDQRKKPVNGLDGVYYRLEADHLK